MADTDLNYVEIAGEDWELAPPDTPIGVIGDAMVQLDIADKIEEAERLERTWRRAVKQAERRRVDPPTIPERLISLTNEIMLRYYRAIEAMLALSAETDDDSDLPTRREFRESIGEFYRAQNNGSMNDTDLEEVMRLVRDAWIARAEAETALPPESSAGSAAGRSPGRTAPSSKPKRAAASKTSR